MKGFVFWLGGFYELLLVNNSLLKCLGIGVLNCIGFGRIWLYKRGNLF